MEDVLITEHAGTGRDETSRFYQYGSGGVRVLDGKKTLKRLYLFDSSSDTMTERDPHRQETILRRFIFDRYGMLEETFAAGGRPRTFRYEDGARRIAVREGGDYGAVGKTITFEANGITETAWGRHGEIGHVYQLDARGGSITVRKGGWYGDVERTITFAGIPASLFFEPESFLQFLIFTEWSEKDKNEHVDERVAEIRSGRDALSGPSPYASAPAPAAAAKAAPDIRRLRKNGQNGRAPLDSPAIDFIPDADAPAVEDSRKQRILYRQSRDISCQERRDHEDAGGLVRGRSAEIPLGERFMSSHKGPDPLSLGKSAEIPLDERFGSAAREEQTLSLGKSAEIPLDERFETARREREKLSRGKSAEIPYDERRGGGDR